MSALPLLRGGSQARAPSKIKEGMWGNFWWNDMERPQEVFRSVLANRTTLLPADPPPLPMDTEQQPAADGDAGAGEQS